MKFYIGQEIFYCLISNEHVITNDIINNQNNIYLSNDYGFTINILLDINKRYIKTFRDFNLDITVVEIIEEDNIPKIFFLSPENEEKINDRLINREIYIPQYPEGKGLKLSRGEIKEINENEFTHLANTLYGSSGSPIILKNSDKVIGIHKGGNEERKENYGDLYILQLI